MKINGKLSKIILIIIGVVALIFLSKYLGVNKFINQYLTTALTWIDQLGNWGVIIYICLYAIATVFLIPGSILTLGAGVIYGVLWGSILVSIASTISASIAFLVGRYLLREWVMKKLDNQPNFMAIDSAIVREGWKIVALTRLSPVFPFNLLNYALAMTHISLKDYFFASWIGMIPGTIMYVYIGSLIGNIAKLSTGLENRSTSPLEWVFYGVGFIATILITIYITKIAKNVLNSKLQQ